MRNETILFASDLDNTLLFSHKHAQAGDVCVEYLAYTGLLYRGRGCGCCTLPTP